MSKSFDGPPDFNIGTAALENLTGQLLQKKVAEVRERMALYEAQAARDGKPISVTLEYYVDGKEFYTPRYICLPGKIAVEVPSELADDEALKYAREKRP